MLPKLVIFDVDGTLLDTEARWKEAWETVGNKYGFDDLGTTLFMQCVGKAGKEEEERILNHLSRADHPEQIRQEMMDYGLQLLAERIDVKKGAFELIEKIKSCHIPIAVATATRREWTIERLTRCGLIEHFDYILCGDEVTKRKPDPETFLTVLSKFNVAPEDALILEDSVVGVEAAYRGSIPCIMIPDLIPASDLQYKQAMKVVDSLLDVVEMIGE